MSSVASLVGFCWDRRARLLAVLFVAYALAGCLSITVIMPPFANADEGNHFMRADAISLGGLIGQRESPDSAGGIIHVTIWRTVKRIYSVLIDRDQRVGWQIIGWTYAEQWGTRTRYIQFLNTPVYPPTSYIPTVLGILLGRAADLSVAATLLVARGMNALAYVAIGAVAIAGSGSAAPLLFSVLLLPMSIVQGAAVTQDGSLIALAAFAASLVLPCLREQAVLGRRRTLLLSVALAMLVAGRPPYLPLAIMPLLLGGTTIRFRLTCVTTIVAVGILWSATMAIFVMVPLPPDSPMGHIDTLLQAKLLLQHPAIILSIATRTLLSFAYPFYVEFIGFGDWWFSSSYYATAWCALLWSILLSLFTPHRTAWWPQAAIITGLVASASALIFAVCYLTFTRPGELDVAGVQGRYFIPLALLIPGMLPGVRIDRRVAQGLALGVVALFPAISIATLLDTIVWRFYVGA